MLRRGGVHSDTSRKKHESMKSCTILCPGGPRGVGRVEGFVGMGVKGERKGGEGGLMISQIWFMAICISTQVEISRHSPHLHDTTPHPLSSGNHPVVRGTDGQSKPRQTTRLYTEWWEIDRPADCLAEPWVVHHTLRCKQLGGWPVSRHLCAPSIEPHPQHRRAHAERGARHVALKAR
jgi:hypothetical protein